MSTRSSRWLVVFLLLAAGCGAVVAILADTPTSRVRQSGSPSALASEIDQFTVDVAGATGDSTPSRVGWVATTEGRAGAPFGTGSSDSTAIASPVYVLEISGRFTDTGSGGTHWSDLWLVLLRSTWAIRGVGVQNTTPSLRGLGTVETDVLTGISPTTVGAWRAKYHLPPLGGCGGRAERCAIQTRFK